MFNKTESMYVALIFVYSSDHGYQKYYMYGKYITLPYMKTKNIRIILQLMNDSPNNEFLLKSLFELPLYI